MPYTATSGANVITHLTGRVGGNSTFWSSQEKRDAFNEALAVWQCMTGEFTTSVSIPVEAGAVFYEVPRQIASVQRMKYNTGGLMPTSTEAMDSGSPGWQNDASGTPLRWMPVGITLVAINPPAASGTLTFDGIAEAPSLANDGDKMDLGDEHLDALLSYGHHYLSFKEGGAEHQATQAEMQKLVEGAGARNAEFMASATFRRLMGLDDADRLRKSRSPMKTVGAR